MSHPQHSGKLKACWNDVARWRSGTSFFGLPFMGHLLSPLSFERKLKSFCGKLLVLIRHDYGPASQMMSWIMLSINSGHDISLDRRQFVQVCFFVLPRCAGYWTMKHFCLLQVKWPMDDIGEKLYHHLDALRNDWPKITAMHQQVRNYVSIAPIFL